MPSAVIHLRPLYKRGKQNKVTLSIYTNKVRIKKPQDFVFLLNPVAPILEQEEERNTQEFIDTDGGKNEGKEKRGEKKFDGPVNDRVVKVELSVGKNIVLYWTKELYYGEFDPGSG